jgi:hypothetical protein
VMLLTVSSSQNVITAFPLLVVPPDAHLSARPR